MRLSRFVLLALALGAPALPAQEPQCTAGSTAQVRAACNTAVDATRAFHPLAGILVSGGTLTLATVKLVAELGYQPGKDQRFTTNFSDFDPTAGHVFWSAGVRFAF